MTNHKRIRDTFKDRNEFQLDNQILNRINSQAEWDSPEFDALVNQLYRHLTLNLGHELAEALK